MHNFNVYYRADFILKPSTMGYRNNLTLLYGHQYLASCEHQYDCYATVSLLKQWKYTEQNEDLKNKTLLSVLLDMHGEGQCHTLTSCADAVPSEGQVSATCSLPPTIITYSLRGHDSSHLAHESFSCKAFIWLVYHYYGNCRSDPPNTLVPHCSMVQRTHVRQGGAASDVFANTLDTLRSGHSSLSWVRAKGAVLDIITCCPGSGLRLTNRQTAWTSHVQSNWLVFILLDIVFRLDDPGHSL